jgi:uncharacterized membrane protein
MATTPPLIYNSVYMLAAEP